MRTKNKRTTNKIKYDLEIVKNMPSLFHTLPGEEFDMNKSEVLEWISKQKEFAQMIFNDLKNSGFVKYDPNTKKWQGVDYRNDSNK